MNLDIRTISGAQLSNADPFVSIREASTGNADNPADAALFQLIAPEDGLEQGDITFGAVRHVVLAANTKYFIVIENDATATNARFGVGLTASNSEDSGAEADWEATSGRCGSRNRPTRPQKAGRPRR